MSMKRFVVFVCCIFITASSAVRTAKAGPVLYQTCVKNVSAANADGLTAQLQGKGLFTSWNGQPAVLVPSPEFVANVCVPAGMAGDLFNGGNGAGQSTFTESPFAKNATVAAKVGLLWLSTVRNPGTNLDPTKSTLTAGGAPVTTKFTPMSIKPQGDPAVDLTNDGSLTETILGIMVTYNNSHDPLDLSQTFMPDGLSLSLTTPLNSTNDTIAAGATEDFSFLLPAGAYNWAFEVTYMDSASGGVAYTDLVAEDVPEPNLSLCVLALLALGLTRLRALNLAPPQSESLAPPPNLTYPAPPDTRRYGRSPVPSQSFQIQ